MKAYLLTKSGPPESLSIHDVPEPEPGTGQVKIKVKYFGINYAEILSRKGKYGWAPRRPYIPGMEGMGEVVATGEGVERCKVGDKVIFGAQYGSYAEYIATDQHLVIPLLQHLTEEENAAFLVNFLTAWVGLVKLGKITREDRVLIQVAAGGVGSAAVQIAKAFGASVFGTVGSDHKIELLQRLGVDYPINYNKSDFFELIQQTGNGVDLVLEVVGGKVFRKSLELLNPFGRMVVIGYASNPLNKYNPFTWYKAWKNAPRFNIMDVVIRSYAIMGSHIGYLSANADVSEGIIKEASEFAANHNLKPIVGKIFEFEKLADAHAWMESRQSVGKIVVKV